VKSKVVRQYPKPATIRVKEKERDSRGRDEGEKEESQGGKRGIKNTKKILRTDKCYT